MEKWLIILLIIVGIIASVFLLLFILSVIGFASVSNTNTAKTTQVNYNGINFSKVEGNWQFSKDGNQFSIKYNPEETKGVIIQNDFSLNKNEPLYIAGDNDEAAVEISHNLNRLVVRINMACVTGQECKGEYPVKSCSNDNIIIINPPVGSETEQIYKQDKCVFIIASKENQVKYADGFLLNILGI